MELREYINLIKRRLWILVLTTIFFAVFMCIYVNYFSDNIYESITTLYVGKQTHEQTSALYDDLLMGQTLVKDYREIAKSKAVSNQVVSELKEEGKLAEHFDPGSLAGKISINLRGDTRVIEIKVEDTHPERARDLANTVAEVFKFKVKELVEIDNVEIIDEANLPEINKPTKPKRAHDIAIASFIGILTGLGIIFLIEYLDNTIKRSEDVEKYLELPVIGTIPRINHDKGGL